MAEFITTTLMDSYAGGPHITETQIGLANQATFGADDYVLEGGRESEAQVLTNNSIRIFDAVYCIQGRRDVIPASGYTDVTIANGTQGMNRNDIIVRRYKKNESSEIESTEYAVIKGTPNAGAAVDPEVTTGDIRSGATLHEMALYRVKITGLNITAVEPMFNILKNMASLQKELAELNSKIITTDRGTCIKHANGVMEQFIKAKVLTKTFSAWGSCYYASAPAVDYIEPFKTVVDADVRIEADGQAWTMGVDNGTLKQSPSVYAIRPNSPGGQLLVTVRVHAIGTWK